MVRTLYNKALNLPIREASLATRSTWDIQSTIYHRCCLCQYLFIALTYSHILSHWKLKTCQSIHDWTYCLWMRMAHIKGRVEFNCIDMFGWGWPIIGYIEWWSNLPYSLDQIPTFFSIGKGTGESFELGICNTYPWIDFWNFCPSKILLIKGLEGF